MVAITANGKRLCDGRAFEKQKMKMSTQVDLFTNVEPTSVSPAIAKPFVICCFFCAAEHFKF